MVAAIDGFSQVANRHNSEAPDFVQSTDLLRSKMNSNADIISGIAVPPRPALDAGEGQRSLQTSVAFVRRARNLRKGIHVGQFLVALHPQGETVRRGWRRYLRHPL